MLQPVAYGDSDCISLLGIHPASNSMRASSRLSHDAQLWRRYMLSFWRSVLLHSSQEVARRGGGGGGGG